jgi:signal transduction histidine kinase
MAAMRRFFPRSLLGQMLLSVAAALLLAQGISAVLLYQAEQNRRESGLIHALAFQLVADPRIEFTEREGRRRLHIERALDSPLRGGEAQDIKREQALREVLAEQGITVNELVVLSRPVRRDSYIMHQLEGRTGQSRFERDRWDLHGEMLLAGLKRPGDDQWLVARVPASREGSGRLSAVVMQTLVLYVVLVGGLAFLLRRITRPLAELTDRVGRFAGRRELAGPLTPSGPDDTRRLIDAHNAMEARIAGLMDEKDVMLGAIGHDLKTPLAALRVRIESVEDDVERAKMAATIEDISRSLDDILSLARVGRPSDPLERTDLAALVSSVVEEYEDLGENVELGDTERMPIEMRATWLRRALRNLIDNALRYGGSAQVTLVREGGQATIRIADEGPGIPEAELPAMLEPFARGEASRNRETGGAGLGLTLARAIAEQHGGTLRLVNRHGADGAVIGLLAELSLPLGR